MSHCMVCKVNLPGTDRHVFCGHDCREAWREKTYRPVVTDVAREIWMVAMFKSGKPMQEIGDIYGISRERVRQILKKHGLTRSDGGLYVACAPGLIEKARELQARREEKCFRIYGCDTKTFSELNLGMRVTDAGSPACAWVRQRNNAKKRDIEWGLTFFQWMTLWNNSGKWAERGLGIGKYCMARKMDSGGYTEDNVYITTCDDNVRDYQARLKVDGVLSPDGWVRLPENEKAITGSSTIRRPATVCAKGHVDMFDRYRNCIVCRRERARRYYLKSRGKAK